MMISIISFTLTIKDAKVEEFNLVRDTFSVIDYRDGESNKYNISPVIINTYGSKVDYIKTTPINKLAPIPSTRARAIHLKHIKIIEVDPNFRN